MSELGKECVEVVEELAYIIDPEGTLSEENIRLCEYRYDVCSHAIYYLGHCVWHSEDDTRKYDDDTDSYEPLIETIKRSCTTLLKQLTDHIGSK